MTKQQVEAVIERIRPFLQAGMCAGCPSAHMTLYLGVETALREAIPEFDTLRVV